MNNPNYMYGDFNTNDYKENVMGDVDEMPEANVPYTTTSSSEDIYLRMDVFRTLMGAFGRDFVTEDVIRDTLKISKALAD